MTRRQKNRCHREQDEISAARNLKKMWGDHKNWLPPENFGSWEGVPGYMYVDMRRLSNKARKAKISLPDLWKEGGFLRRHYEAEGRRFNRGVLRKAEFDIDRLGTAPRGDTRWIDLTKEQLQACIEQLERKSQLRDDAINAVMLGVWSQLPADEARSIGFTPPLWFQIDSATIPNGLPPLGKDCKLLLVPLHHRSIPHWTIVTIDLASGIVVHYDSRLDVNRHGRVINALGPFLRQHLASVDPVFERAVSRFPSLIPGQMKKSVADCGSQPPASLVRNKATRPTGASTSWRSFAHSPRASAHAPTLCPPPQEMNLWTYYVRAWLNSKDSSSKEVQ